ncbi:MAG: hypothetical protein M3Y91_03865, partial [Actinomycetota bacterium]|nr:hypothetical protein [Actinomycetota bacterium]
ASVHGAILNHYQALGGPYGFLGFPTSDQLETPEGTGAANFFAGGSVYWTPAGGAWSVHGAIMGRWIALGWERSPLGYPASDEYAIPGGRQSNFQHGTISWNPATGTTVRLG